MKEKSKGTMILYNSFIYNKEDKTNKSNNKYFLIGTKEGCTIYRSDPLKKGFKLSKKNKIIK